ncbi:MAG: hypothetical protein B7Z15_10010 [Rhizobiales bacterium 32-66-8]|nr:MAG: hypothetical protein B7Z15_10010 [Rhizobiales bacterium 32-66-8]
MTLDQAPDNQPTGITMPVFILVAVLVIAAALTAVWFAIPGPDTRQRLVSPSGTRVIELAELCTPNGCNRVAVLDVTRPDGSHIRTGCPLERAGLTPLFAAVTAAWSPAEDRIDIAYVAATGPTGTVTIVTADCTQTE